MLTKKEKETLTLLDSDIEQIGRRPKTVKGEKVFAIMELVDRLKEVKIKEIKERLGCSDTALARYRKGQKADYEYIKKLIKLIEEKNSTNDQPEHTAHEPSREPSIVKKCDLANEPTEKLVAELTRRGFSVTLQFKDKG